MTGVALGSDAFFPFGDNIERARKSGVAVCGGAGRFHPRRQRHRNVQQIWHGHGLHGHAPVPSLRKAWFPARKRVPLPRREPFFCLNEGGLQTNGYSCDWRRRARARHHPQAEGKPEGRRDLTVHPATAASRRTPCACRSSPWTSPPWFRLQKRKRWALCLLPRTIRWLPAWSMRLEAEGIPAFGPRANAAQYRGEQGLLQGSHEAVRHSHGAV